MAPNPSYDPTLGYSSSIKWGGKTYSGQDLPAFKKWLKKHGKNYQNWARSHPNAANVFDPISQTVYSEVHPQTAAMERMRQQMLDTYKRRFQNLGIFTNALNGMLGEIPGMISGPYREGAETMRASGSGYGHQLNADSQAVADVANQTLSAIGAPEGQMQSGGDAGSVLAGMAGWLPAEMMDKQGAAFAERAAHLPVEAQLTAMQMARDLMDQQGKDTKELEAQMLDMAQGIPGLRAKVEAAYAKQANDERKQSLAEAKLKFDYWKEQARIYAAAGRMDLSQQANTRAEQARADAHASAEGVTPSGGPKPGYHIDPNTNKPIKDGWHYDPKKKKPVKDKTASGSGGDTVANKWTPSKRSSMASDARIWINQHKKTGYNYYEAYNYLYQKWIGYVGHGITQDQLGQVVTAILYSNGAKPGQNGGSGGGGGKPGI